jgi:hypothetical protein
MSKVAKDKSKSGTPSKKSDSKSKEKSSKAGSDKKSAKATSKSKEKEKGSKASKSGKATDRTSKSKDKSVAGSPKSKSGKSEASKGTAKSKASNLGEAAKEKDSKLTAVPSLGQGNFPPANFEGMMGMSKGSQPFGTFANSHVTMSRSCMLHNKTLRYFCDSCEELICYDCTVMGPHNT